MNRVNVIAFGAHADDVELSCGGTLARCVAHGQSVGIVDLTHGEMGTRGTPETRLQESLAAQRALGATFRERLDFGDGGLRSGRDEELAIIRILRKWRPQIILVPWPDDRHPDHTRTGRLVTEAAFYSGLKKLDAEGEAHRPQAVLYYQLNYPAPPSLVVDITPYMELKMNAVRCYESQFFNPDSKEPVTFISQKGFLDMIEARARHYGSMIGAQYGEAFVSKAPPRVNDLLDAYHGREVS
jgi:bacillithiol biosynthesis deacetylase BshB1